MKTYKKYENRKYYDLQTAEYVNVQDILRSYLNGGARVIEHSTKTDITPQTISRALVDSFKPEHLIELLIPHAKIDEKSNEVELPF